MGGCSYCVVCGELSETSVDQLHVVGGKHSMLTIWTDACPPAFIYHVNVCDDVIGVKGYLCFISCSGRDTEIGQTQK